MNYIITLIQDIPSLIRKSSVMIFTNVDSKENLELTLRMLRANYTIEEATEENLAKYHLPEGIERIDLGELLKPIPKEKEETFIFNKISYEPDQEIRSPAPSKYIPGNNPKPYSHKRK
jgi:hypothetical protein